MPLPPNTLAELQRDMARLGFVVSQIREVEEARQKRLEQRHETGTHAMVRRLARIVVDPRGASLRAACTSEMLCRGRQKRDDGHHGPRNPGNVGKIGTSHGAIHSARPVWS
jgi:hypothetical protein